MPLYIPTNVASLHAQKSLNSSTSMLHKAFQRLSSGRRINTAADDAAGSALSEGMRAQIRSLSQAERNSLNAISMTQTAEGGLGEISAMLVRIRELSVQAANGDLTATTRSYIDVEVQDLLKGIDRIAEVTEFNGQELLAGPLTVVDFQVGIQTSAFDTISVNFGGIDTASLTLTGMTVGGADGTNAQAAIDSADLAMQAINARRAEFGSSMNRFQVTVSNIQTMRNNLDSANSNIRDADIALESSEMAKNQVLQQASTAVLAQANMSPQLALKLISG